MCYHKVYNRADMDLNLGLDKDLNTIKHDITPTVTVRKLKKYIKGYYE